MNAGVPWTAISRVSAGPVSAVAVRRLDDAEIQDLHEVVILAVAAQEDVGGLDVAVDETARLGLGEGVAHLPEQVDGPLRRDGSRAAHERLGVEPIEQFHHVVERAVGGDAEIEEVHGMRRAKAAQ